MAQMNQQLQRQMQSVGQEDRASTTSERRFVGSGRPKATRTAAASAIAAGGRESRDNHALCNEQGENHSIAMKKTESPERIQSSMACCSRALTRVVSRRTMKRSTLESSATSKLASARGTDGGSSLCTVSTLRLQDSVRKMECNSTRATAAILHHASSENRECGTIARASRAELQEPAARCGMRRQAPLR